MSIWNKLRNSLWGQQHQLTEIEEEMAFHLEAKVRDLERAGHSPQAARRQANKEFGNRLRLVDETQDTDRWAFVDNLWRDTRLAVRNLSRRPGLVVTALLSIGLGLGANAAIFSIVDTALFRPLPLPHADRLINFQDTQNNRRVGGNAARLYDFAEQMQTVEAVSGFYGESATLTGRGEAERISMVRSFGPILQLLATNPALGRGFTAQEERGVGERVAMLTSAQWRKRFNSDPQAIGQTLLLSTVAYTIIGILPADLTFPEQYDVLAPADADLQNRANRRARYLERFARMKDGVSLASVNAELATVNAALAAKYPDSDATGMRTVALNVQEVLTRDARTPLLLLLGTAGFVLLIACVNVSNLLLARAGERLHEASVRASLGAGLSRLLQLYLVESLVLAAAGGVVGWLVAGVLLPILQEILPSELPRLAAAQLDGRVFGFALAVTLLCGLLFGALPAIQLARARSLVSSARATSSAAALTTRRLLVATQMGLSIILLVAVGLLGRALMAAQQRPLGFVAEMVWTAKVDFSWTSDGDSVHSFSRRALERLATLPGVESVGLTDRLPLEGGSQDNLIEIAGRTLSPEQASVNVAFRSVSSDYLSTLRVPLRAGRWFQESAREAVVNETFVRTFFPEVDSLGRIVAGQRDKVTKGYMIVGVVPDVRREVSPTRPMPEMFLSYESQFWPLLRFAVRGNTQPGALRQVFREIDPNVVVGNVSPLNSLVREATGEARTQLGIVFAFAFLALGLAAVGLYGVLSSDVVQRTREMGIRLALGAAPGDLVSQVVKGGVWVTAAGLAPGLAVAVGLATFAKDHLPGVNPIDGMALAGASGVLLLVAVIASYLPARRAARVNPLLALRQD